MPPFEHDMHDTSRRVMAPLPYPGSGDLGVYSRTWGRVDNSENRRVADVSQALAKDLQEVEDATD